MLLLSVKKMFPKANSTANNESDVPNTISEEETADNYSFDDEEDDFATSPEENDETAPVCSKTTNAVDDTATMILKKNREKLNLQKKIKAGLKKAAVPALIAVIVLICTFIAFFIYSLSTIEEDKVMKNVVHRAVGRLAVLHMTRHLIQ